MLNLVCISAGVFRDQKLWVFGGVPYTHMQAHTCEYMHVCIHVKYDNFTWKWLLPWGKPWGNTYDVTHMYVHVYVCT